MSNVLHRNHVQISGRGRSVLVFGHGLGCDQQVWHKVGSHFENTHQCVLFDHVGFGRSDLGSFDRQRHATLHGYAEDLVQIGKALHLHEATFVGHSMGAMVGLLADVAHPGMFASLVLLSLSPRYLDDPPYVGGFQPAHVQGLLDLMDQNSMTWAMGLALRAAQDSTVVQTLTDSLSAMERGVARQVIESVFLADYRAELPKVRARCLVVQCSDDDIVPVSVGEYVAAHLPDATYRLLEATGHLPHLTHVEAIIQLIEEFLERSSTNA